MSDVPRLLFVHAHPDDETIFNGVTLAHYAARGADVTVLTCTLGEEGEVIGDRWAQLTVDHADQLGGYRIGELTGALDALGLERPRFLGGAGLWRDSGMAGTTGDAARRQTRFVDAATDVVVSQLADVIAELRPHVVVTYDPNGGYGHPDHIRAHEITTAALDAAAPRWQVPKFYWVVISAAAFRTGVDGLAAEDVEADWIRLPKEVPFGFDQSLITAVIDAPEQLPAKVAAMTAHATQMTVGPTGRAFALSNKLVLPLIGQDYYILVRGVPGPVDDRGWETDLLAGLDFAGATDR